ncbi:MAG: efflux RND transporter periplasmic adaptor subunit [Phaeodactylibacter sp.]|nr:efflux RND transporter periplasmic adaptor subunit [Phaeodactylibacter sp.]
MTTTSSIKSLITPIILALALGLGVGYFLFGHQSGDTGKHQHAAGSEEIWTCSMHPQIRQNEPGKCPICGMDLTPLKSDGGKDPLVLEMSREAVQLAQIQTTIVGETARGEGPAIRLSGKVQPDERLAASQVAHVPGRIEKLYISFTGEQVQKGQKIASLYSPELITAQRELLEALKLQAQNPALVEAARKKLQYWKIDNSIIERIEQSGTIQETFEVYADETGIVTERRVSVGDYVQRGSVLFELMNLSRVWVLFDAYEEDLGQIRVGDRIQFSTPALPGRTFQTAVTFIDPVIDPASRVASIRTEVQNQGRALKPEMLVYGSLQGKKQASAQLTVPKSAVLWTGRRSVVYLKVPDTKVPSFEFREIEIGEALGDSYPVLSGLEAGEEVVTYGSFVIDAAAQLNNQASMMNRQVAIAGTKTKETLPDFTDTAPAAFKTQLQQVASAYLHLKDALVATDGTAAQRAAKPVLNTLKAVDMSLLSEAGHSYWMEQQNAIQAHTRTITETDDVKTQREQFDFLSQALIRAVKAFGIGDATLYVQHCPMAFDNDGADWLSSEKQIQNPYFGDAMLTCGLVKTTIDAAFKNTPDSAID